MDEHTEAKLLPEDTRARHDSEVANWDDAWRTGDVVLLERTAAVAAPMSG